MSPRPLTPFQSRLITHLRTTPLEDRTTTRIALDMDTSRPAVWSALSSLRSQGRAAYWRGEGKGAASHWRLTGDPA